VQMTERPRGEQRMAARSKAAARRRAGPAGTAAGGGRRSVSLDSSAVIAAGVQALGFRNSSIVLVPVLVLVLDAGGTTEDEDEHGHEHDAWPPGKAPTMAAALCFQRGRVRTRERAAPPRRRRRSGLML